jgi:transcriptional regulator with XRE-family HTH domain
MREAGFVARLQEEWETRRKKNPRYSLRAFASFLGTDHSTLSQILRGARRIPVARLRSWARKLGIDAAQAAVYVAAEHAPDARTVERQNQLRHWTAEALAVANEPAHWHIVRLSRTPEFRPDCRWIADQIGGSVDAVNMALSRLLRLRLLQVIASGEWKDLTGLRKLTEREFRKLALARVRQKAAEARLKLVI